MRKRKSKFLLFTFVCLLCFSGCSVPNLEKPECTEARDAVREFYSFHIGTDMKPSAENLKLREKFLSKALFKELSVSKETREDYFTKTVDYPKTFRVGDCEVSQSVRVHLRVLLFWKSNTREEQQEISVVVIKEDGKWVISDVASTNIFSARTNIFYE